MIGDRPATAFLLPLVALVACSGGGSGAGGSGAGGETASTTTGSTTTTLTGGAGGTGGNTHPPGPDPSCTVADVDSAVTTISVDPAALTTADAPVIHVTDAETGHTNVAVRLCTPTGPQTASFGGVDSGSPPFAWHWTASPLPLGTTQILFSADPSDTVYRTLRVDVAGGGGAGGGGGVGGGGAGGGPTDMCNPQPGNLLSHVTFEDGMDGLAPAFWQVRSPDLPNGACLGSGTPEQHVFLSEAAPGCGGHAVTLDARGQWDCYAIQLFSDYNTITGGATYRISVAARSQGNAVNPAAWFHIGAQWLDANDGVFGDVKNPKPASGDLNDYDWKVLFWDVVAPPEAHRIVVWLSAHYPGRVDFDNVSVVKL